MLKTKIYSETNIIVLSNSCHRRGYLLYSQYAMKLSNLFPYRVVFIISLFSVIFNDLFRFKTDFVYFTSHKFLAHVQHKLC